MTPPITYDPRAMDPWQRAVRQGFVIFFLISVVALPILIFGAPKGSWVEGDPVAADKISRILEHAAVTLISSILASLFLAIPLTANNYSPQLVEAFVGSWANRFVLGVFIVSAGFSVWITQATTNRDVAVGQIYVSFGLVALSISLLLPYVLGILRLIDPDVIISLVAGMVMAAMKAPAHHDVEYRQRVLLQRIDQLGNIILRALDRADRDTALSSVQAMEYVIAQALASKATKAPAWFVVTSKHFPGLSPEAVNYLNRDRTWVEMEMLRQLARAFSAALQKTPDVISAIVRAVRHSAVRAASIDDRAALDLAIRFCNNFLREAVKRKDLHAIYDVVFQYRYFAETLFDASPDVVVKMIRHLDFYGRAAADAGIPFAHDLIVYDVASIIIGAAAKRTHPIDPLVRAFLMIRSPRVAESPRPLTPGCVKARAILAASLAESGHRPFAEQIEHTLATASDETLLIARHDLLETAEESFWEVTDRQRNFDYVEPEKRAVVAAIFDRVTTAKKLSGTAAIS